MTIESVILLGITAILCVISFLTIIFGDLKELWRDFRKPSGEDLGEDIGIGFGMAMIVSLFVITIIFIIATAYTRIWGIV